MRYGITFLVTRSTLLLLVVLIFPLKVLVYLLVVLVCSLVELVCLFRLSTRSTRLAIHLSARSICLSTRSTRLSTRSICLSTRSTRSTICQSFYNWSFFSRLRIIVKLLLRLIWYYSPAAEIGSNCEKNVTLVSHHTLECYREF